MQATSKTPVLTGGFLGCLGAFIALVAGVLVALFVLNAPDDLDRSDAVVREQPDPNRQEFEPTASETSPSAEPSEWAPHPSYPTPEAAGTQAIYLLEEPERSRVVKQGRLPAEAPARQSELAWSDQSYCEVGWDGVACAHDSSERGSVHFRRGRASGYERVERWLGDHRQEAWETIFDANQRPVQIVALDEYGEVVWTRSYQADATAVRVRAPNGANLLEGCGLLRLTWEGRRATQVTCEQWGGRPMADRRAVVTTVIAHDAAGFAIEERYLDSQGEPMESSDRVHRETIRRDPVGRELQRSRFAIDGSPVSSLADGCHAAELQRDELGRVVESRCFDHEGGLHAGRGPVASRRYEYDTAGCLVATTLWGVDGEPVEEGLGRHREEWEIDTPCVRSAVVCRNRSGDEVRCGPGQPPRTEWRRDRQGRIVSARHFADGQPTGDAEFGVFEVRSTWDERDNLVETACFAPGGGPIDCGRTGFHARISIFDDAGREIETRFRSTDGGIGQNNGAVRRTYVYDIYDHQVESNEFDAAGHPTEVLGASRREDLWTHGHRLFAVRLWAADGSRARFDGCYSGHRCPTIPWHAVRVVRAENGEVQENLFFDHEGQLMATFSCLRHQCFQ